MSWTVNGDFSFEEGYALYQHNTGSGSLVNSGGIILQPNAWFQITYTISNSTGAVSISINNSTAVISTTNGVDKTANFRTGSQAEALTFRCTSSNTASFRITDISVLKYIGGCINNNGHLYNGGNLYIGGNIYGNSLTLLSGISTSSFTYRGASEGTFLSCVDEIGTISPVTINAASFSFAPYGNLVSTDIQSAIEELDREKVQIDSFYNVSIGGSSPSAKFQVYQSPTGVGSVSYTNGNIEINGVDTKFLSDFRIGDNITIDDITKVVSSILNDTALQTTTTWSGNSSGQRTYYLTGGTRFSVLGNGNISIGSAVHTGQTGSGALLIRNAVGTIISGNDQIAIYSKDSSSTVGATLALATEYAVESIGTFTPTNKGKIWWNGVEYWVQLDAV